MSDSLMSSLSGESREARIAEIEEMLDDYMYERGDLETDAKWLIAELRASLSREEEANYALACERWAAAMNAFVSLPQHPISKENET